MKPIPDCVPDALRMILAAARAVSDDDFIHRKVLLKVMSKLSDDGDLGTNPADLYFNCWESVIRSLGVKDPYEKEKARGNKTALGILKNLYERSTNDGDLLRGSIKISFAGAMIFFTGLGRSDTEEKIGYCYTAKPGLDETDSLVADITKAETVMIVADRAGEIALDRPLAEYLVSKGKKVFLAVTARPVFSMATEKDAETAGFTPPVEVVSPGTAMYGLVQERASSQFRECLEVSDLVIVKGDTHFCTMSPQDNVYFIVKAGTKLVAERLGIAVGDGAIVRGMDDNRQWR